MRKLVSLTGCVLVCLCSVMYGQTRLVKPIFSNGATCAATSTVHINATLGQSFIGVSSTPSVASHHGVWFVPISDQQNEQTGITTLSSATAGSYSLSPNPVTTTAHLRFSPACRSNLRADLYAISGKFIQSFTCSTLDSPTLQTGLTIDASDLSSGIYSLRIHSDCDVMTIPILVSK